MSVYSGFPIRQQEQQYNSLVQLLLVTLSKRLLKLYNEEECNEKAFRSVFYRIMGGLKTLETIKYNQPKFSESIKNLYEFLLVQDKSENENNVRILLKSSGFEEIKKQASVLIEKGDQKQQKVDELLQMRESNLQDNDANKTNRNSTNTALDQDDQNNCTDSDFNRGYKVGKAGVPVQYLFPNSSPNRTAYSSSVNHPPRSTQSNKMNGSHRPFQQTQNQDNIHLPQLIIQEGDLTQEFVDKISKDVENNLINKLMTGGLKRKKRNNRNKTVNQSLVSQQIRLKIDQNSPKFEQAFMPYHFEEKRIFVNPVSETNKTRPKFYSIQK